VTLGGFATLGMTHLEGDHARFRLDGLDLFVFFDPSPYLHFSRHLLENPSRSTRTAATTGPAPTSSCVVSTASSSTDRANLIGEYLTGRPLEPDTAEPLT
jgi:hypothetical protein